MILGCGKRKTVRNSPCATRYMHIRMKDSEEGNVGEHIVHHTGYISPVDGRAGIVQKTYVQRKSSTQYLHDCTTIH
jgi:hypothetical protein